MAEKRWIFLTIKKGLRTLIHKPLEILVELRRIELLTS